MIGYKKVALDKTNRRYGPREAVVKLETIGKVIDTGRKLRVRRAKVLSITTLSNHKTKHKEAYSKGYGDAKLLTYKVGKVAVANGLETDECEMCGRGINFFRTFREAASYYP